MAQEFLSRSLERLTLSQRDPSRLVLRSRDGSIPNLRLQFVTIAHEPSPTPLTREQASGRTSYSYPSSTLAYVGEGTSGMFVSGVDTQPRIRMHSNSEFASRSHPTGPACTRSSSIRRPAPRSRRGRGLRHGLGRMRGFAIGDW